MIFFLWVRIFRVQTHLKASTENTKLVVLEIEKTKYFERQIGLIMIFQWLGIVLVYLNQILTGSLLYIIAIGTCILGIMSISMFVFRFWHVNNQLKIFFKSVGVTNYPFKSVRVILVLLLFSLIQVNLVRGIYSTFDTYYINEYSH